MEAEKREEDLQNLFIRLTHLYFKKAFALVKDTGIHPKQVPLIGLVYCREGISQKEISQALRISPPTVAVSIKRLEKAGISQIRLFLNGTNLLTFLSDLPSGFDPELQDSDGSSGGYLYPLARTYSIGVNIQF